LVSAVILYFVAQVQSEDPRIDQIRKFYLLLPTVEDAVCGYRVLQALVKSDSLKIELPVGRQSYGGSSKILGRRLL
jgi:hypothetical protein